ncbi:MAG: helix-turn-helix transcriptional regulator [Burkholderiales bacterium]|nr:helix-turn-helix transcriptional regulator [Burkholderiales bacterium]
MNYVEYTVPPPLSAHVQCLWRLRDAAPDGAPQTVYPDGRCELIVHLARPMQIRGADGAWRAQSRGLFAGQARSAIRLRTDGALDCIGVRLRPAAGATLFDPAGPATALAALVDQVVDLRTIDAAFADALTNSLAANPHPTGPVFLRLLADRLRAGRPLDARVAAAVDALDAARGQRTITALARELGIALRSLQTAFLAAVGMTAKEYARVQQLQATIRQLDAGADTLADAALAAGFADQAHATRAVRAFAGLTPARLRRALQAERDGDRTLALAAAFVRGASCTA